MDYKKDQTKTLLINNQVISRVKYLIRDLPQKIGTVKGKNVVFVVGNTGAGKSTAVNYMRGYQIRKEAGLSSSTAITVETPGKKMAQVGSGFDSETLYPELYDDEANDLAYYDCAGFIDNRGLAERICASLGTEFAVKASMEAEKITLMVVINAQSLENDRGDSFKKLTKTLGDLLNAPDTLHQSVLFVFTRCKKCDVTTKDYLLKKLGELSEHFSSTDEIRANKILKLMKDNPDNIVLLNVFDQGHARKSITDKLKALRSISKSTFSFAKYDGVRELFNSVMIDISAKGQLMMDDIANLSKKLRTDKLDFNDCDKKLAFYETQVKEFTGPLSSKNKAMQVALLKDKIKSNEIPLERANKDLQLLKTEMNKIDDDLSKISVDTPLLYHEETLHDSRWHWFGKPMETMTSYHFKYTPPQNILSTCFSVETFKDNGSFEVLRNFSEDGYYNARYDSERAKDGIASVKYYIKTSDKPDNKVKIKQLKVSQRAKNSDEIKLMEEIDRLSLESSTFQSALEYFEKNTEDAALLTKQQIVNLTCAQRLNLQKFNELKKTIPETENSLQSTKSYFEAYDYDKCEVHLLLTKKFPNKKRLDELYRSYMPMIISYKDNLHYYYSFDRCFASTKLSLLTLKSIKNLVFETAPTLYQLNQEIFLELQHFCAKNDHAYFMNNFSVFETVANIAGILNYDSLLFQDFLKSTSVIEKSIRPEKSEMEFDDQADSDIFAAASKNKGFACAISTEIMSDPVVVSCGHTFERNTITQLCSSGCTTCPVCRSEIQKNDFKPNFSLKENITAWQKNEQEKSLLYSTPLSMCFSNNEEAEQLVLKISQEIEKLNKRNELLVRRKNAITQIQSKREKSPVDDRPLSFWSKEEKRATNDSTSNVSTLPTQPSRRLSD